LTSAGHPPVAGLLLAAGEGKRYGKPKALARTADGVPWLASAADVLLQGGCDCVVVVLGASAAEAAAVLPEHLDPDQLDDVTHVRADGWQEGMGASLRVGLRAAAELRPQPVAVLIGLVDTPGVTREVVARVLELASPDVLAQATYGGRPGHPVLIEQELFASLRDVTGDRGARNLLMRVGTREVPCDDLGGAEDVDTPDQLEALRQP